MFRRLKFQWPAFWWAVFIFTLCTVPMGSISQSPVFFAGFDKLVHCGLFFVLSVLLCAGYTMGNKSNFISLLQAIKGFFYPLLYGGLIELLQKYIFTWRSGEWADFFADSVGCGMAVFGVMLTIWAVQYENK